MPGLAWILTVQTFRKMLVRTVAKFMYSSIADVTIRVTAEPNFPLRAKQCLSGCEEEARMQLCTLSGFYPNQPFNAVIHTLQLPMDPSANFHPSVENVYFHFQTTKSNPHIKNTHILLSACFPFLDINVEIPLNVPVSSPCEWAVVRAAASTPCVRQSSYRFPAAGNHGSNASARPALSDPEIYEPLLWWAREWHPPSPVHLHRGSSSPPGARCRTSEGSEQGRRRSVGWCCGRCEGREVWEHCGMTAPTWWCDNGDRRKRDRNSHAVWRASTIPWGRKCNNFPSEKQKA